MKVFVLFAALALTSACFGQSTQNDVPARTKEVKKKGAAGEVGSGIATTAGGAAKGAGSAASGAGKGAVELATLHPINAGAAVGTGAAKAGKDVTVGSAKGVGKIGKGLGHALKKIL